MKGYVIILGIVLAVLIVGLGALRFLSSTAEALLEDLDAVGESIDAGDWSAARASLERLQRRWDEVKGVWAVFIPHGEIDLVEESLAKLAAAVESENLTLARSELAGVRFLIRHIPENEVPSFSNIL
mgnify:CR=1 FL=1